MERSVFFEEAAILESHGIEVQSPGGHSNSDEVDGNDFPDQVTQPCHIRVCVRQYPDVQRS